jgi:hypothetical protein
MSATRSGATSVQLAPPDAVVPHAEGASGPVTTGSPRSTVHEALAAVMAEIGAVPKDRTAPGVSYKFQGIADILSRAQPAFARHGMALIPTEIVSCEQRDRTTKNGGAQVQVDLHVRWRLYGPAGDWLPAETWGQAFDTSDKATNKAHTAAHKVALKQIFSIPEDADDQDMERPELGAAAPPEPKFTKTVAKKVAVREFRQRGYDEAKAKSEAAQMWDAFGMDGLDLSEALVVEKVSVWVDADAEPFPEPDVPVEPHPVVDPVSGEVLTVVSPDQQELVES